MKLRNKRTGEIVEFGYLQTDYVAPLVLTYHKDGKPTMAKYNYLAELNEKWEDYREPKVYWYIEPNGVIARIDEWDCCTDSDIEIMKTLGNYFETKEEAEKAVEKLKAWKRLKDKGIKIGKRRHSAYGGEMYWDCPNGTGISDKQIWLDLDLLFGGEE